MSAVTVALSLTGEVFGMHATAVNPPATAAAVPVATVSLCSCPGSRRWTCMSMNPGQTTKPSGISTMVAPSAGRLGPTRASPTPSIPLAGSTTRPPLSSLFMFRSTGQQVQDRHAHRDAVGDLVENHRVGPVRNLRRDLDAAVHRSRMHDHHV